MSLESTDLCCVDRRRAIARADKAEAERDRLAATVARVRALDTGYQQGGGNFHAYCISPVRLRAALAADPTEGAGDD